MNDYLEYEEQNTIGWFEAVLDKEAEKEFVEEVSDGFYIDCSNMIH